jgi:hypothetical protein
MHRVLLVALFVAGCSSNTKSAASCDELRRTASSAFGDYVVANRRCVADSDCTIAPGRADCFNKSGCAYPINQAAAADAGAYLTALCAPVESQGCGPPGGWQGCLNCRGPVCYVDAGICECQY